MKRIISLIITLSMLLSVAPVMAAGELSWDMPNGYYLQEKMPIKPVDNYHSMQNSPSFSWPIIYDATYELVLANDKELTDIAYEVKDIPVNVYTFPHTLEAGKDYYWAVRYKLKGKYSVWTAPRRLYIDEKAYIYTVPPISDIGSMLKPHPRLYSKRDLELLSKVDQTTDDFKTLKLSVDRKVNSNNHTASTGDNTVSGAMKYIPPSNEIHMAALFYYMTGEEKYKKYAIEGLDLIKDNNPADFFDFTSTSDTAESIFAYNVALTYDILYDYLTEEQRENAIRLIERNLKRPFEGFAKNGSYERSLYAEPFGSHNWRLNQCTVAGLAIYNESDIAKKLVDFHFPILTASGYPFGYQDGASAQGPFYGIPVDSINVAQFIENAGLCDLTNRAYASNAMINLLYLWPSNWISSIGDAYNTTPQTTYQVKQVLSFITANAHTKEYREFAKWMLKRVNSGSDQYYYSTGYEYIKNNANQDTAVTMPYNIPTGKYFHDIDWIALYSDMADDNRVGINFKSSWYGSHNHSHPDQNSFVIEAYGKEIARDSDYYDSYHSTFDLGFNKKTYAHNAITYDNGVGQPLNSISAKGDVTDFINQRDFKLAAGDATTAYGSAISKALRKIIYINPETFIVIDDLATSGGKYEFEYWLNTLGDISFYDNNKGATIVDDHASMEVRAHYPENMKPHYIDFFAGPDLTPVPAPTVAQNATDKRLYFQTEKTDATKIVTTLDIHRTGERVRNIKEENCGDYLKLSFEDGSVCYINLTDKEIIETKDDISFKGLAFIYNKDSFMLADGTYAKMDGKEIFSSDVAVSVAKGREEISVSSIFNEANIKLMGEKPGKLVKHNDIRLYDIEEGKLMSGVTWNYNAGNIEMNLYPGTYTLYTDKRDTWGEKKNGIFKLTIDDVTTEIPYEAVKDINGKYVADVWGGDYEGAYRLDSIKDVSAIGAVEGKMYTIDKGTAFYVKGDNPEVKLTSVGKTKVETVVDDNEKDIEPLVDYSARATEFSGGGKGTTVVWWARINNNTLQNLYQPMQNVIYTYDIKEAGEYDIVMSVSTVSGTKSDKIFILGDQMGLFHIPATDVYSNLQSVRVKSKVKLEPGTVNLEIINTDAGQCIFDWIGLMKSEK